MVTGSVSGRYEISGKTCPEEQSSSRRGIPGRERLHFVNLCAKRIAETFYSPAEDDWIIREIAERNLIILFRP
jgi:hypothetical protein